MVRVHTQTAGKLLPSGVRAYFGIPFAAAPVLANRWREAQPARSWQGTYHADRFAPECIQILRPSNINHYFGAYHTSEVPYFPLTQDVYNSVRETRAWAASDRELAQRMSDLLIAFARTGRPETRDLKLPSFDVQETVTVLDTQTATFRFDKARMDFFATIDAPGAVGPATGGARARD